MKRFSLGNHILSMEKEQLLHLQFHMIFSCFPPPGKSARVSCAGLSFKEIYDGFYGAIYGICGGRNNPLICHMGES